MPIMTSSTPSLAKWAVGIATALSFSTAAIAQPAGVFRPDLLPKEQTTVIDVANFLRWFHIATNQQLALTDSIHYICTIAKAKRKS